MDPVTKLLAIEEIKQLKAQYFQRLDSKDMDRARSALYARCGH